MNRELVIPGGAGIYPLQGDVQSTAGNAKVKVIGLQGIALQSVVPASGSVLEYNVNTNQWEPILNAQIQVNGLTVSDDPLISVNVSKPIKINGA